MDFTWNVVVPSVRVGSIQIGVGMTGVCVAGARNWNPFCKNRNPSRTISMMIPIPIKTDTMIIFVLSDKEEFWFMVDLPL